MKERKGGSRFRSAQALTIHVVWQGLRGRRGEGTGRDKGVRRLEDVVLRQEGQQYLYYKKL
jgi:hypothetical protein